MYYNRTTNSFSTFFASVSSPANLIEMSNNALASHIYRINFVLSVFVGFFEWRVRKCVRKVWGLRQEACWVLITTPDKRPALRYKLFLIELNQAWDENIQNDKNNICINFALVCQGVCRRVNNQKNYWSIAFNSHIIS